MKPLVEERASGADVRRSGAERIDAMVVGSDDTLLIELGALLGERYRTHTVDSPADISAAIDVPRWIGIIDADSLADPRAAIARLEAQYPRCPLVLVSDRAGDWSAAIGRGAAVAAVGRDDLSGPLLLEALTRAESRLRVDATAAQSDLVSHSELATDGAEVKRRRARLTAGAAVAVAVVGIGAWGLHHHQSAARAAPSTAGPSTQPSVSPGRASADTSTAPPSRPQSVLELLSAARIAFQDQKLLLPRPDGEPRGDSALELYTQVISQDPGNDEAQDGVRRLFAVGKARIQSDISSGKLDDAGRLVQMFREAGVAADELAGPSASITSARPRWLQSRVEQSIAAGDLVAVNQLLGQLTASGADPALITQLRHEADAKRVDVQLSAQAAQMRAAIAAGNLLMPPDDALTRFTGMRTLARSSPITVAAQHELQAALVMRANTATHAAQFDSAQRYLSAAADLGTAASVSDARYALQAAISAAARARVAPVATAPAPAAVTPAPTAPAVRQAPEPSYLAARPTRPLTITYPSDQRVAGAVVVEFTLRSNGTAADVSVVQSNLPANFGRMAIQAVVRGRFDTSALTDGQPRRARLRLRFQPGDTAETQGR